MSLFCDDCKNFLCSNIFHNIVISTCPTCGNRKDDTYEYDSLLLEESNSDTSVGKYDIFIKKSPFDPSSYKVRRTCNKCKLDYMTLIRIGEFQSVIYTCKCGNIIYNQDL